MPSSRARIGMRMPTKDPPASASLSSPFCGAAGTVTSMVTVVISRGDSAAGVVGSATGRIERVGCTLSVVACCSPVTSIVRCSAVEVGMSSLVDAKVSTAAASVAVAAVRGAGVVVLDGATTVVTLALVDGFGAPTCVELEAEATVDERVVALTALEAVDGFAAVVLRTGVVVAVDGFAAVVEASDEAVSDAAVSDGPATTVVVLALVDGFGATTCDELGTEATVDKRVAALTALVAVDTAAAVVVVSVGAVSEYAVSDGSATTVVTVVLVDGFGATARDELGTGATGEAVVVVAVVVVGSTEVVSVAEVGCCEGALVDDSTASSG